MTGNLSFVSMTPAGVPINVLYTGWSFHFFAMPATRGCLINLMREMRVNQGIPLEEVFQFYESESKLYRGRPEMLVMRMRTNRRNVQLFRGGKVQILGPITQKEAENMRREIILRLRRVDTMRMCQVSPLTITNMVASLQLPSAINLRNIPYSNRDLSYEVELFPAALIRKWHPIHVALFHNGKMIVTGVKEVAVLKAIFNRALKFVSENHL